MSKLGGAAGAGGVHRSASVESAAHQAHVSSLLVKSRQSDVRGSKCVRRAINFNNFGNNFGKFRNGKNHDGDEKSKEGSDASDNNTREDARSDGGFGEFVSDNRYPFNSAEVIIFTCLNFETAVVH